MNRFEDGKRIANTAFRTRKVDDHAPAGHASESARQHGGRHSMRHAESTDRLGDARQFGVEEPPGHLGGLVGRIHSGATSRDDKFRPHGKCHRERIGHWLAIADDDRTRHLVTPLRQPFDDQRSGVILVDSFGRAIGGDDHPCLHDVVQSPLLPPDFATTSMPLMMACLSTAFTISITVSAATLTAVSASISTPVRSVVRTVAVISTDVSASVKSTSTPLMASGWHSGIKSGVRFVAMIPATRATPRASPLGTPSPRSNPRTTALTSTRPRAVAERTVTSLPEMSTIRAAPLSSTCVRRGSSAIKTADRAPGFGPCRPC